MTLAKLKSALRRRVLKYVYYPIVGLFRDSRWTIPDVRVERIGSAYGGGWIAPEGLDERSIAYSIGIGCDITFDQLLIRKTGCKVFGFDPTPKSAEWIHTYPHVPSSFTFIPIGLAETTGRRKLFLPSNSEFVSGSIARDLEGGFVECNFSTLDDLMRLQNHAFVDLLKIDIEGAEFSLFEDWLARQHHPPVGQIWVEFHPEVVGRSPGEVAELVRSLETIGFTPAKRAYFQNPNHYLLLSERIIKVLRKQASGK